MAAQLDETDIKGLDWHAHRETPASFSVCMEGPRAEPEDAVYRLVPHDERHVWWVEWLDDDRFLLFRDATLQ